MTQYFPKPYEPFGRDINVKFHLPYYATKANFKNAARVDTSKLIANSDLASLRTKIGKTDVGKLKTIPVDLSKLSNVVNYDVVKKTVYDKIVAQVNNINTSGFVLKTKYQNNKSDLEKKMSDENK